MTTIHVVRVELVREKNLQYPGRRVIRSADDAAEILKTYMGNADREHFVTLCLSVKHAVNAIHTVSIGSLDAAVVHPREVFKVALLANASAILVGHLHPSGDSTPSPEDIAVTKRIVESGRTLGIDVLDHIVIGDGQFTSLKSLGYM